VAVGKLNFRATQQPQGTVVKIGGEVTVEEADDLERDLQLLASSQGSAAYVIDLSGLAFAASLAIGCLLRFRSAVIAAGGRVALADVQPMVNDSLHRAHLHRVFHIYPTVNEALTDMAVT
jgi:anti-sigma B factor antagonist